MPIVESPPDLPLVLDNNVFTHLRNKQPYALEYIRRHFLNTRRLPVIPSLIIFESNFGIQKAWVTNKISAEQADFQIQEINKLASIHTVLDFNQKAAEIAAYIFARLSKSDKSQHWRDLFIAATAIAYNYGLATQNKRDMELIANHLPTGIDLRLAIWKP